MTTVQLSNRSNNQKLVIGASVLGGIAVLALLAKFLVFGQQSYLVPTQTLAVGSSLDGQTYKSVRANLGNLSSMYLPANSKPAGFATQALPAGMLVPLTAIAPSSPGTVVRLVITTKTALQTGLHAGSKIQIWSAQKLADNQFDTPKRIVPEATLAKVIKQTGVFAGQNQEIEVLMTPANAPAVMAALASNSPVFVVAEQ